MKPKSIGVLLQRLLISIISLYVRLTAKKVKIAVPRKSMELVPLYAKMEAFLAGVIYAEMQMIGSASTVNL